MKWVDTGLIVGHRMPGSNDRRVLAADLVAFLEAHGLPLGDLAPTPRPARLACGLSAAETAALGPGWAAAADAFELGVACQRGPVGAVVVGDEWGSSAAAAAAARVLARHPAAAVLVVLSEDAPAPPPGPGVTAFRRPGDLAAAVAALVGGAG